jgi:hypothetical protein
LVSKLLIELAKARLSGKRLTDLIATLQDPHDSKSIGSKFWPPMLRPTALR